MKKISFAFLLLLVPNLLYGASLTLTFTDNANNEDGFKIERKTGLLGTFTEIDQIPASPGTGANVTYVDNTIPDTASYCYQVKAFNIVGTSGPSNIACGSSVTIPVPPTLQSVQ